VSAAEAAGIACPGGFAYIEGMPYQVALREHASHVEARVSGEFGGVAEAVRIYDGIGRACIEKAKYALLIVRDYTIAPNPEEGRLLMSELTRIESLSPLKIAYVVPHATSRLIELVEMANAYRRTMWRVFTNIDDATAWITNPEAIALNVLDATGVDHGPITGKG